MPKKRTPEQLYHAIATVRVLAAAGMSLFPLQHYSKLPRDKGFLLHDYAGTDWADHLKDGGNIGVKARRDEIFMDVDPRNGGELSFDMLCWDLGVDFEPYPLVRTGSGGRHYYMRVPEGARLRHLLKAYPGIDFQGFGRYVVAPGSMHPDTGKPYVLEPPLMAFAGESKLLAPQPLLDLLAKPPRPVYTGEGGDVTCDKLAGLLAVLDAADFGKGGPYHDEWLDIAMACHHATDGEGYDQWLDWCAEDPQYGDDSRAINLSRWESFDAHRGNDMVTYRTLLKAVTRAGHPRLVARLENLAAVDDFDDDPDEYAADEAPATNFNDFR